MISLREVVCLIRLIALFNILIYSRKSEIRPIGGWVRLPEYFMSSYDGNEYIQILTAAIREDSILPFDCYLLLPTNQRIVRLIKKGEPFEISKIKRLKVYRIVKLYIKREDLDAYVSYLREFSSTPTGESTVREVIEKSGGDPVPGIPDEIHNEFLMRSPPNPSDLPAYSKVASSSAEIERMISSINLNVENEISKIRQISNMSEKEYLGMVQSVTDVIREEIGYVKMIMERTESREIQEALQSTPSMKMKLLLEKKDALIDRQRQEIQKKDREIKVLSRENEKLNRSKDKQKDLIQNNAKLQRRVRSLELEHRSLQNSVQSLGDVSESPGSLVTKVRDLERKLKLAEIEKKQLLRQIKTLNEKLRFQVLKKAA